MKTIVIIPTYRPQKYIFDCLNSLKSQTANNDTFSAVIVVNGQKEPYFTGLFDYLFEHQLNYKLLYTEKAGVSHARNMGIDYASVEGADSILFLDDDDVLSPNYIEALQKQAATNCIVASNTTSFIDSLENAQPDYLAECYRKNIGKPYNLFDYRCFLSNVCGKLLPLSVVQSVRFSEQFSVGEDSLFGFQLSKNIDKIVLSDKSAVYYRRLRPGSASRSKTNLVAKVTHLLQQWGGYTISYLKAPGKYNFLFYSSRMAAAFLHLIK